MKGFFDLRTPLDLLSKLETDYGRVSADPMDSYAAYDFFVTAWHLVEWKFPPPMDAVGRSELLARHPVLRVCEHLAIGAKHFEPTSPRHRSVADTSFTRVWEANVWAKDAWGPGVWRGDLMVELEGDARVLGERLSVQDLADVVIAAWRSELRPNDDREPDRDG